MAWQLGTLRYHRLIGFKFTGMPDRPVAVFLMPNGDFGVTRVYGDSASARCNFLATDFEEFTKTIWAHEAFGPCEITSSSYERGNFIRVCIDEPMLASLFKLTFFGEFRAEH